MEDETLILAFLIVAIVFAMCAIAFLAIRSKKNEPSLRRIIREGGFLFLVCLVGAFLVCVPIGFYAARKTALPLEDDIIARGSLNCDKSGEWILTYPYPAERDVLPFALSMREHVVQRGYSPLSPSSEKGKANASTIILYGAGAIGVGVLSKETQVVVRNLIYSNEKASSKDVMGVLGTILGGASGYSLGYWLGATSPPSLISGDAQQKVLKPETWKSAEFGWLVELTVDAERFGEAMPSGAPPARVGNRQVLYEVLDFVDSRRRSDIEISNEDMTRAYWLGKELAKIYSSPDVRRRKVMDGLEKYHAVSPKEIQEVPHSKPYSKADQAVGSLD